MKKKLIILFIILCFSFGIAGELHVDKKQDNEVKFISKVAVLTFEGITDQIDGYIYWEGEEMFTGKSQVYFEVDLNDLDTGIGKRDRDMREVLETDKWRYTIFEGQISDVQKVESELMTYKITVDGQIMIHGVKQDLTTTGTITLNDEKINAKTTFKTYLDKHNIEAPSLAAFVKVNNEINLELDFYLKKAQK